MRVRFTPSGRRQFLDTVAHIARDDHAAARRFKQRAETGLRRLERFPASGRILPEFPELPYREVIVSPYRFFYRVVGRTVWVAWCSDSRGTTTWRAPVTPTFLPAHPPFAQPFEVVDVWADGFERRGPRFLVS